MGDVSTSGSLTSARSLIETNANALYIVDTRLLRLTVAQPTRYSRPGRMPTILTGRSRPSARAARHSRAQVVAEQQPSTRKGLTVSPSPTHQVDPRIHRLPHPASRSTTSPTTGNRIFPVARTLHLTRLWPRMDDGTCRVRWRERTETRRGRFRHNMRG